MREEGGKDLVGLEVLALYIPEALLISAFLSVCLFKPLWDFRQTSDFCKQSIEKTI